MKIIIGVITTMVKTAVRSSTNMMKPALEMFSVQRVPWKRLISGCLKQFQV